MNPIFHENLQFGDIWPRNRQKIAQIEVFGHFLDFPSLVFLDFAHNDRSAWCLVVFLQFAGPVNVFLLSLPFTVSWSLSNLSVTLYNSWPSIILYFINVEDQLNSKNLQVKLCIHLPKFHPQYSLELSVLYIPVLILGSYEGSLLARFQMPDSLWNKFVTQMQ